MVWACQNLAKQQPCLPPPPGPPAPCSPEARGKGLATAQGQCSACGATIKSFYCPGADICPLSPYRSSRRVELPAGCATQALLHRFCSRCLEGAALPACPALAQPPQDPALLLPSLTLPAAVVWVCSSFPSQQPSPRLSSPRLCSNFSTRVEHFVTSPSWQTCQNSSRSCNQTQILRAFGGISQAGTIGST